MTWQRIDEDTYIDDSLVTCAEYQLFIDEMREQGKYYQPDHWTSYEFLKGQSGKLILGVRPSDAVAFCEWLTSQRDGCSYRLPLPREAEEFPILQSSAIPMGCWVMEKNKQIQFALIGTRTAKHADSPEFIREVNNARARIKSYAEERSEINKIAVLVGKELGTNPVATNTSQDLDGDINRAIERALPRPISLNIDYMFEPRFLIPDRGFSAEIPLDNELVQYLDRSHPANIALLEKISEHILKRAFERAAGTERFYKIDGSTDKDINNALDKNRDRDIDYFVNVFMDLTVLRERIAGRSPAFEGIRLVKELRR